MTYELSTSKTGCIKVRTCRTLAAKFLRSAHEHNEFGVEHCSNTEERRVLKFLVPILNPKKPTTITNKLLKAIFKCYHGNQVIGWELILEDVNFKEVNKVSNKKGCPLAASLSQPTLVPREEERDVAWRCNTLPRDNNDIPDRGGGHRRKRINTGSGKLKIGRHNRESIRTQTSRRTPTQETPILGTRIQEVPHSSPTRLQT